MAPLALNPIFRGFSQPCSVLPQCRRCWAGQGWEVAPWGHPGPCVGHGDVPECGTAVPESPAQLIPADPNPLDLAGETFPAFSPSLLQGNINIMGLQFLVVVPSPTDPNFLFKFCVCVHRSHEVRIFCKDKNNPCSPNIASIIGDRPPVQVPHLQHRSHKMLKSKPKYLKPKTQLRRSWSSPQKHQNFAEFLKGKIFHPQIQEQEHFVLPFSK